MPTQPLKERLQEVMDAMEWEYADLVSAAGVSHSVVSQWLGRGSKTIHSIGKMAAAERIEEKTGYAALWLAKGEGPKKVKLSPDKLDAFEQMLLQDFRRLGPGDKLWLMNEAKNIARGTRAANDSQAGRFIDTPTYQGKDRRGRGPSDRSAP